MFARCVSIILFIFVSLFATILGQWWDMMNNNNMGPGTADHHTSGTILSQDGGNALRNDGHTEYYANQNSWNNPNAWNGMQWPAFPSFGRR